MHPNQCSRDQHLPHTRVLCLQHAAEETALKIMPAVNQRNPALLLLVHITNRLMISSQHVFYSKLNSLPLKLKFIV